MIYPQNFEQKIGFDKVRQLVKEKCLSSLGTERTDEMSFLFDYDSIKKLLYQTNEFVRILDEDDEFPVNYFFDVRPALKRIRVEGTYLTEQELFDLRRSLETIQAIVRFFKNNKEGDEEPIYPYLSELAGDVAVFPQLISRIDSILDKFGRVKDNASAELAHIRNSISSTLSGISRNLNSILRVAQSEGFVDKDVTPTMRDGRLVIPVAPSFKRKIKGIVHDESASGKTVFIEPAEVVEANNRVRELESEERREIIRILSDFAGLLRPEADKIICSYEFMAEIDFIRAKALFAKETNSTLPVFENCRQIDWFHAIHPLLFLSLQKQQKQVIPLDISLDDKNRILLISGPNAGGKSVCLKTVGLLQYMLQSGLLIPVYDNSRTGIFRDIFIDIGDEQSIENDLSTYSSHLTNMKYFVRNCNDSSILLIDEFGGGTEPQIGGAIAEALLDRFNRRKSYGVITTHYHNLKHFAEDTDGIINGAMLYDRHLMQPLFKLSIGNPGSSFAIEIARKIGLPEDVISDASQKVGSDYIDMDKYLQDIVRDKRYWESKRQGIRQKEKKLEEITERYENDIKALEKQRKEWILQAKSQAEHILSEANARIENTIRQIKEAQAEKEKTREIRRQLDEFKNSVGSEQIITTDDKITRKIQKIKEREEKKKQQSKHKEKKIFKPEVIEIGDAVRLKGQTSVGEVIAVDDKEVQVAFGMIKSTVKAERLEKVSRNQIKRENNTKATFVSSQTTEHMREKQLNFRQELDVRGMRADEALQAVTYFIDDAIQVNSSRVRILHGTGTGALRQAIRQYLHTLPGIRSFRDEHVQFGGAGITIVELD
ncbi:Smr/MutS family protein [Barnesiella propionica]|uniref:endonuclease MutS2 n=1 Tax=Barnesiella propionica TaxID=2981781 RepID=UPI0011C778F8|nr:Smr/MutS family protein [Barnesiella propionica]MCU6768219.1 Smr/MutS family protein [Barnesiella propionica]